MVGHSNLGLADAFYTAAKNGRLRYFGIRHEGAAAFAASGYAKLTGRPAACFSIAGPGATNLLTGLWDAKVDRVPILALTGQVNTQVLGPGAFQEVALDKAFDAVAAWSQTVLRRENATELMALALKHAIIKRDVGHLIFPDEMQTMPAVEDAKPHPQEGRIAHPQITPPADDLDKAIAMIEQAERPGIIIGNGARPFSAKILALAKKLDAPIITTFKAKGAIAAYQKAIDLDPNFVLPQMSLAACYRKLECEAEYVTQVKLARKLIVNEDEYNRACFEAICGNMAEAVALLERAIAKAPNFRKMA